MPRLRPRRWFVGREPPTEHERHGAQDDEDDEEEVDPVKRLSPTINEVDGRVHIDDLVEEFNYNLPEERDYDTIGGFVFSQLGHIPKVSETLEYGTLRFTILEADPRRILKLRIECDESLEPVDDDE